MLKDLNNLLAEIILPEFCFCSVNEQIIVNTENDKFTLTSNSKIEQNEVKNSLKNFGLLAKNFNQIF